MFTLFLLKRSTRNSNRMKYNIYVVTNNQQKQKRLFDDD